MPHLHDSKPVRLHGYQKRGRTEGVCSRVERRRCGPLPVPPCLPYVQLDFLLFQEALVYIVDIQLILRQRLLPPALQLIVQGLVLHLPTPRALLLGRPAGPGALSATFGGVHCRCSSQKAYSLVFSIASSPLHLRRRSYSP